MTAHTHLANRVGAKECGPDPLPIFGCSSSRTATTQCFCRGERLLIRSTCLRTPPESATQILLTFVPALRSVCPRLSSRHIDFPHE